MGYYAFGDCLQLKSVSTGNGLTSITTATFSGCKNLIEIDIGNSVTSIYSAFSDCGFTDIYIPDGLVLIIEPLGGVQPGTGIYPSVRNVFYKGTRDGWNRIVGNNSPCIMYAKIYFYSENRPSVKGDFWHYDESGKTAIW